jgi:hypothetical protein
MVQRAQNVAKRQAGFLNVAYSSFLCPELLTIVSDLLSSGPTIRF